MRVFRSGEFTILSCTTYGVSHMTQSTAQIRQSEGGFTLVELAIVMIIIGLLIGGILKGQELIINARVSSTVAQIKAIESGISGFRDKYASFPGDIALPGTRLPNCAGTCSAVAAGGVLGNGLIEPVDVGAAQVIGDEVGMAFIHLSAAGMVGGAQSQPAALGIGQTNPATPLGGHMSIAQESGGATTGVILNAGMPSGTYVMIKDDAVGAVATADDTQVMTPANAGNIDRKLDDGQPNTGSVRAVGVGGAATNCALTNTAAGIYNESVGGNVCGVVARVQ
jgi:prepilin-type N-terminal cleavage/methylation domain-containing protein